MKVSPDLCLTEFPTGTRRLFQLPEGLVGFPQHHTFELSILEDQPPFMLLHLKGPGVLEFVVIEPQGIIADYELELFDEDAEFLGIKNASDAFVINIVTVPSDAPTAATVNLAGPVVVNRHTGVAKQCILANYFRYSAHHPLVEASAGAAP
jgi:flagellar assembly factor FliW